jgi:hypothetical protein
VRQAGSFGAAAMSVLLGIMVFCATPASAVSFRHPPAWAVSAQRAHRVDQLHEVHTKSTTPGWIPDPSPDQYLVLPPLMGQLGPAGYIGMPAGLAPATAPIEANVPLQGRATAYGCPAALSYLEAYAAPDFILQCPGADGGHAATTMCISLRSRCDLGRFIVIADPCPAAYMNEASNSWVLMGLSDARIDPYGDCR